jgi:hypothetical protein
MREAESRTKVAFDPHGAHRLIIKSVSTKQRPRRPADKGAASVKRSGEPGKGKKAAGGARIL